MPSAGFSGYAKLVHQDFGVTTTQFPPSLEHLLRNELLALQL